MASSWTLHEQLSTIVPWAHWSEAIHYAKVEGIALLYLIQLGFETSKELLLLLTVTLLGVVEDIDQLGLVDSVHHGDTTVELNNGDIEHVLLSGLLSRRIYIDLIELEGDLCKKE